MIQVSIYLELVQLGSGNLARYGVCAILTYGEAVKATGQYLGVCPMRAEAVGAAARLAVGALTRPCVVQIYSASVMQYKKQRSLFDRPGVELIYMPLGAHYRERAAYWAAWEIALGGEVTDSILEMAVNTEETKRRLIAC